jgi:hypothetical protein
MICVKSILAGTFWRRGSFGLSWRSVVSVKEMSAARICDDVMN